MAPGPSRVAADAAGDEVTDVVMNPSLVVRGHVVAEGFVDRCLARILYDMLLLRQWRGESRHDDQVPDAHSWWGDATLDAVLLGLRQGVEAVAGCALLPTYSYARLYLKGHGLPRHRDRAACEIVATIHLGHNGATPPPIRFEPDVAVTQEPGDAVVFLGTRVEHWRDEFEGVSFGQLFLNYVRADGPRQEHVYDGRTGAFPPSTWDAASSELAGRA